MSRGYSVEETAAELGIPKTDVINAYPVFKQTDSRELRKRALTLRKYMDVISLYEQGCCNREIANRLGYADGSIRTIIGKSRKKFGLCLERRNSNGKKY